MSDEELMKNLLLLENDLDAEGWDQPPSLYAMTAEDQPLVLMAKLFEHPAMVLRVMWENGLRIEPETKALVISFEGWRHLTFDEFLEVQKIPNDTIPPVGPIRERIEKLYNERIMRFPRASLMSEDHRIEVRNITIVYRDGTAIGILRDREKDPVVMQSINIADMSDHGGTIPEALYNLINNIEPRVEE